MTWKSEAMRASVAIADYLASCVRPWWTPGTDQVLSEIVEPCAIMFPQIDRVDTEEMKLIVCAPSTAARAVQTDLRDRCRRNWQGRFDVKIIQRCKEYDQQEIFAMTDEEGDQLVYFTEQVSRQLDEGKGQIRCLHMTEEPEVVLYDQGWLTENNIFASTIRATYRVQFGD